MHFCLERKEINSGSYDIVADNYLSTFFSFAFFCIGGSSMNLFSSTMIGSERYCMDDSPQ